ncbi:hypothetical protein V6U90_09155 [Micromonospora sp. CPCC 206060]|uniref:hypothetical protein n=1 Tax=Micromonospora sp. CPCC 206060 TaxID=3122406 RepID=UPI002FEE8635
MTDNRSSRWGRGPGRTNASRAELSAVLDSADLSERVRAAIAHALADPVAVTAYVNAVANRYATERERRTRPLLPPAAAFDPRRRWTLHLTYPANDLRDARDQAVTYAEGLTILRPELAASAALISRADAWNHIEPVFCGRVGPDDEVCMDVAGHPGFHRAAGLGGLCWGDGDDDGTGR